MVEKGIQSYKDLIVWQKSVDLVMAVYKLTEQFPKPEIYGLTSQMRRASISIPSNIAEGKMHNPSQPPFFCLLLFFFVIPAKAGIQTLFLSTKKTWIPAFAGMTGVRGY